MLLPWMSLSQKQELQFQISAEAPLLTGLWMRKLENLYYLDFASSYKLQQSECVSKGSYLYKNMWADNWNLQRNWQCDQTSQKLELEATVHHNYKSWRVNKQVRKCWDCWNMRNNWQQKSKWFPLDRVQSASISNVLLKIWVNRYCCFIEVWKLDFQQSGVSCKWMQLCE
jgi:hypothetical protein